MNASLMPIAATMCGVEGSVSWVTMGKLTHDAGRADLFAILGNNRITQIVSLERPEKAFCTCVENMASQKTCRRASRLYRAANGGITKPPKAVVVNLAVAQRSHRLAAAVY